VKVHLTPTHKASKAHKKDWLIYEMLRYKKVIQILSYGKMILSIGLLMILLSIFGTGWMVLLAGFIGLIAFDRFYEFGVFAITRHFLFGLGDAIWDGEASTSEHDLRILMNRVENYLDGPEEKKEALYKDLVFVYAGLRFKSDLTEAIHELAKEKQKQEQVQS
jgi:hypothetical protein